MATKETNISQFTYRGIDIDVLFNNKKLSYIFELKGKRFGNMVKVDGRKSLPLIQACVALVLNAVETIDAAEKI